MITAAGVVPTAVSSGVEGRTFQSVLVIQNGQPRPLLPGTVIRLRIADGGLRAHAGGNLVSGRVDIEQTRLAVTGLRASDLSYAPDQHAQDTWLSQFLATGPAWTHDGDELRLRAGGTEIRLAGQPETDRPLLRTYWLLESTSQPGGPPTRARVHAHLVFDDGEVNGGLACNWIGGWATMGDGTIAVDGLGTTKRMCREEDVLLEIAIFAVLQDEVAFDLGPDRLDLTGADGRRLHLRAAF